MQVNIVTSNACLSIPSPFRFNGAFARAERYANALYSNIPNPQNIDVICFQELIVNRSQVLKDLIHHPHYTKINYGSAFGNNIRFLESGLTIASKWPIVKQINHVFSGPTYHFEAFMAKSILYAKIKVSDNFHINVFNTHTQAWANLKAKEIRFNQFKQIAYFIDSMNIPSNEPVFLCGDFNFDFYEHGKLLEDVMSIVDCTMQLPQTPQFTFDPTTNQLVGTDDASEYTTRFDVNGCYETFLETGICSCCPRQMIDGIATSNIHLQPSEMHTKVIQNISSVPFEIYINISTKRSTRNVSDHYCVYSTFTFLASMIQNSSSVSSSKKSFEYQANQHYYKWVLVEFGLFFLLYFIVVVVLHFLSKKRKKLNNQSTELN